MRRSLHLFFYILTALHLVGGHWGVLQTFAWAQMIHDYSSEMGVADGIKATFDGEHPCAMCTKIKQEKDKERQETPRPLDKADSLSKWLPLLATQDLPKLLPAQETPQLSYSRLVTLAAQWTSAPATPPPRLLS